MLTNEQTARFKAALKKVYEAGVENGLWIPTDEALSKIIWRCLNGAEMGQFSPATAKIMDNYRHDDGEPDDLGTRAEVIE